MYTILGYPICLVKPASKKRYLPKSGNNVRSGAPLVYNRYMNLGGQKTMAQQTGVRIGNTFVSFDCTGDEAKERLRLAQEEQEKARVLGRLKDALRSFGIEG